MPRRTNATPLSEERLLDTALKLIDEAGLDGLSMRKLGSALSVDPMAVYYYFPNKQALLRRVVEAVFGSLRPIAASGSWQARVRDWAYAYREIALAHPHLVLQIVTNADAVAVAVPLANESLYAALRQSGLREESVPGAGDLIVDYVHGYVLGAAALAAPNGRAESQSFEFALKVIVTGLEETAVEA